MSDNARPLAQNALFTIITVADFDQWKTGFDAHEDVRRAAGFLGHHLNRGKDDANLVGVFLPTNDLESAKAFGESDELKQAMAEAGVSGPPDMNWLAPKREAVIWDQQLPAMTIVHAVADLDRWLEGYDAADDLRTSNGIVGHAANQSLDDPAMTTVYHQAESFDALQAFMANPALKDVMKAAGVVSEPEVAYWNGGWAKFYDD